MQTKEIHRGKKLTLRREITEEELLHFYKPAYLLESNPTEE